MIVDDKNIVTYESSDIQNMAISVSNTQQVKNPFKDDGKVYNVVGHLELTPKDGKTYKVALTEGHVLDLLRMLPILLADPTSRDHAFLRRDLA